MLMRYDYNPPKFTDNPSKRSSSSSATDMVGSDNGGLLSGGKAHRKKSRVIRSRISDFHATTDSNICNAQELLDVQNVDNGDDNDVDMGMIGLGRTKRYHHVCKYCNKAFSSGRALGGHIRIHGASLSGVPKEKADSSNSSSSNLLFKAISNEEEDEGEVELSNGFSRKMVSLYTLRNNPKRSSILMDPEFSLEMLGAKRSCKESGSVVLQKSESGSEHRAAAGLVLRWSVTRNRSNRSLRGHNPNAPTPGEDVADERDTANLLVMLASNGNGRLAEEERELTEESVCDSKAQQVLNLESWRSGEGSESGEDSGWSLRDKKKKKKRRRRRRKPWSNHNAVGDAEEGSFSELRVEKYIHRCNVCKKVFNSHQALGGHRASHRNVKGCFAAQEEQTLMIEYDEAVNLNTVKFSPLSGTGRVTLGHFTQEQNPEQESFSKNVLKGHQCLICHRVFASGQALGGHKRCHWIGDKITETTTTSAISTEKQLQQSGAQIRNSREELPDLNQPLRTDEDKLEASNGTVDVVPALTECQPEFENAGSCDP